MKTIKRHTSKELKKRMARLKQAELVIYSFFPVDKGNCVCQKMVMEFKKKMALMPQNRKNAEMAELRHLECPADKTNKKRYEITCKNCKGVQGYCWASDPTLEDFVDLHYTNWSNGDEWFGNFTVNVSPIDQKLGIECTCGSDTRDFRPNMTLPGKEAAAREKHNKIGRNFGQAKSLYGTRDVTRYKQETIEARITK